MAESMKVTRMEVQLKGVQETILEMKGHQESRAATNNAQYTEMIRGQAATNERISVLTNSMENYQKDCITDRAQYASDISTLKQESASRAGGVSVRASLWFNGVAMLAAVGAWIPLYIAWKHLG